MRENVLAAQMPGQRGAIGTGALHPDRVQPPEPVHPRQQPGVSRSGGRELRVGRPAAVHQHHRRMMGAGVPEWTVYENRGGGAGLFLPGLFYLYPACGAHRVIWTGSGLPTLPGELHAQDQRLRRCP